MPEHIRALALILILGTIVFALAKGPVTAFAMREEDFVRRRNMWFAVTLIVFLSHNFWIFLAVTGAVLLYVGWREPNPIALFVFLMFAVPTFSGKLSGFGLSQLLVLDYSRVLALTILLPATFRFIGRGDGWSAKFRICDILVACFLLTQLGLRFTIDSGTNTLRYAIYALLDVGLPYFVASRSLRDVAAFRDVLMSLACVAMFMSLEALQEALRYWLPYASLIGPLNVTWGLGSYLSRGAFLRAQVSTGQPIVLGYILVVAIEAYAYLRRSVPNRFWWWLGFLLLVGGLISTFSRGPWLAAAAGLLIFVLTAPRAVGGLVKSAVGIGLVVMLVMATPLGEKIIDYLPFVGTIESENVAYRQHLLDVSIQLIFQHPWFGSFDYLYALAEQDLVMGGMVDIVNTYLGVGLANGLVGLVCFAGAFIIVALSIFWGMRSLPNKDDEIHTLGSGLLACIVGTMATIFTVSSISFIPLVYWTVLGLGVGYVRMVRNGVTQTSTLIPIDVPLERPRFVSRLGARV